MPFISKLKFVGWLMVLVAGLCGCATPSGSNGPARDEIQLAPGVSIETGFRAASAAGNQMNYSVKQDGNRLIMEKRLPTGAGHFGGNLANHRNRITVSPVPGTAGGSLEVRVVGEYLGDPRDKDVYNCLTCDVNKIKKAIREVR
ncbi:MAG: hypothetical protein HY892_00405 [Deltaproteobacteria bacterium]|nr:hypothetical protein [Deltaproteobacteria bacterium]